MRSIRTFIMTGGLTAAAILAGGAGAFAATPMATQLQAQGPNGVQAADTTLRYTATAQGNGSTVLYQFWEEFPTGWRVVQNYSAQNTFQISNAAAGSYPVVVYALDQSQIAAHQWSQALNRQFIVNVGSTASLTSPVASMHPGQAVTVTAGSTHLIQPQYQFWYETPAGHWVGSAYSANPHFAFTPTQSGVYQEIVYAKDPSAPSTAQFSVTHQATVTVGTAASQTPASTSTITANLNNPAVLGTLQWNAADAQTVLQAMGSRSNPASVTANYAEAFLYAGLSNNLSILNAAIVDGGGAAAQLMETLPTNVSQVDQIVPQTPFAMLPAAEAYPYNVTYTTTSGHTTTIVYEVTLTYNPNNSGQWICNVVGAM